MHLDHGFGENPPTRLDPLTLGTAPGLHNRVEHGDDVMPLRTDLCHDGIDDKRTVPANDFENAARHLAAVPVCSGRRAVGP